MSKHHVTLQDLAVAVARAAPAPIEKLSNAQLADRTPRRMRVHKLADSGQYGNAGEYVVGLEGQWTNTKTDGGIGTPALEAGAAYIGSDTTYHVYRDSGDVVADGPDGEIVRDTDARVVLEACDDPGATIQLDGQTTYPVASTTLSLTSDDLAIVGPPSAVLRWDDGVVGSETDDQMEVTGNGGYIGGGWTFDGGSNDIDAYGLRIGVAGDDTTGNQWTINGHRSRNAAGDAYGVFGDDVRINCVDARDFFEDGVHVAGDGVRVANSYFRGVTPIKVQTGNDGMFTNCTFIGDDTYAVGFRAINGAVIEGHTLSNCKLVADVSANRSVRFDGDGGGVVRQVTFDSSCTYHNTGTTDFPVGVLFASGGDTSPPTYEEIEIRGQMMIDYKGVQISGDAQRVTIDCTFPDSLGDQAVQCNGGTDIWVSGPTLTDVDRSGGTRVTVNGRGFNDGSPANGGQWNGNENIAQQFNLDIEDTTNGALYKVLSSGTWTQTG